MMGNLKAVQKQYGEKTLERKKAAYHVFKREIVQPNLFETFSLVLFFLIPVTFIFVRFGQLL